MKRRLSIKIKSLEGSKFSNDEEPSQVFWDKILKDEEFISYILKNKAQSNISEIDSIISTLHLGEI